ncbi:MAG TPA: phasin family protein [Pseudolabrys sp.]|nr:phasin family protein [Pseudolabrys sp.]
MPRESGRQFDIPADMRALADRSVEQAKEALEVFMSAAQHAVNAAETQAADTRAGVREVGELALNYAERNIASSFDFAQKLLQAREPGDVLTLHADYVNGQIGVLTEQAKELSKRAAKLSGQGMQH